MVFSSLIFTYYFLPLVVVIYYMSQKRYRNYIILVASLAFYSYGEPKFIFIMLASIIINYLLALAIDKCNYNNSSIKRTLMILAVVLNISILFVYKYLDFGISITNRILHTNINVVGIALPIGISFFTFQALSYVIDVYKGTVKVQKNLFYVALYISFFPQLIAGPIVRYSTIEDQILNRKSSLELFASGFKRFMLGFCKKIIIANNVAEVATKIFGTDVTSANQSILWLGAICYSLQIYYDFSGYSDMAIGLGKMFGFQFEENFNYPYIARSITDFWRRWHISLSSWFRDYVYIPLGGSRVSTARCILNLFIVWTLTGIWHGANYTFIAWGFGYFILLVIEKYLIKPDTRRSIVFRIMWQLFTLICVNFGWVIFNSPSLKYGVQYCLAMIGFYGTGFALDENFIYFFTQYWFFIMIAIMFSTPIVKILSQKISDSKSSLVQIVNSILIPIGYAFVFLWAVSYLILGAHNPFIYFNF